MSEADERRPAGEGLGPVPARHAAGPGPVGEPAGPYPYDDLDDEDSLLMPGPQAGWADPNVPTPVAPGMSLADRMAAAGDGASGQIQVPQVEQAYDAVPGPQSGMFAAMVVDEPEPSAQVPAQPQTYDPSMTAGQIPYPPGPMTPPQEVPQPIQGFGPQGYGTPQGVAEPYPAPIHGGVPVSAPASAPVPVAGAQAPPAQHVPEAPPADAMLRYDQVSAPQASPVPQTPPQANPAQPQPGSPVDSLADAGVSGGRPRQRARAVQSDDQPQQLPEQPQQHRQPPAGATPTDTPPFPVAAAVPQRTTLPPRRQRRVGRGPVPPQQTGPHSGAHPVGDAVNTGVAGASAPSLGPVGSVGPVGAVGSAAPSGSTIPAQGGPVPPNPVAPAASVPVQAQPAPHVPEQAVEPQGHVQVETLAEAVVEAPTPAAVQAPAPVPEQPVAPAVETVAPQPTVPVAAAGVTAPAIPQPLPGVPPQAAHPRFVQAAPDAVVDALTAPRVEPAAAAPGVEAPVSAPVAAPAPAAVPAPVAVPAESVAPPVVTVAEERVEGVPGVDAAAAEPVAVAVPAPPVPAEAPVVPAEAAEVPAGRRRKPAEADVPGEAGHEGTGSAGVPQAARPLGPVPAPVVEPEAHSGPVAVVAVGPDAAPAVPAVVVAETVPAPVEAAPQAAAQVPAAASPAESAVAQPQAQVAAAEPVVADAGAMPVAAVAQSGEVAAVVAEPVEPAPVAPAQPVQAEPVPVAAPAAVAVGQPAAPQPEIAPVAEPVAPAAAEVAPAPEAVVAAPVASEAVEPAEPVGAGPDAAAPVQGAAPADRSDPVEAAPIAPVAEPAPRTSDESTAMHAPDATPTAEPAAPPARPADASGEVPRIPPPPAEPVGVITEGPPAADLAAPVAPVPVQTASPTAVTVVLPTPPQPPAAQAVVAQDANEDPTHVARKAESEAAPAAETAEPQPAGAPAVEAPVAAAPVERPQVVERESAVEAPPPAVPVAEAPPVPADPAPEAPASDAAAGAAQGFETQAAIQGFETEDVDTDGGEAVGPEGDAEGVEDGEGELDAEPEDRGPAAPGYDDASREAVHRVMRERRDVRAGFRPDAVPDDVLVRVLEAAHAAPSVGYSQPWDFVVIRSEETRVVVQELAQRQREAYASSLPKARAKQFLEIKVEAILETPVNIVVTVDTTRGGRHTLGRHTQPQMGPYSSALAVENLWLAARAEGLGVGWVSFFDERELAKALGLPDHVDVVAYLCVGYVDAFPEEPELASSGWAKARPLSWVVHEETYGRRGLPGEEPVSLLEETLKSVRPLDAKALGAAWEHQRAMTKPPGSLGILETIGAQLSGLARVFPPPVPEPAAVAVFAGDHGVHAQGVSPWPQEVTAQMVRNFLAGGAVVNAFAKQVGVEVCVVDVGVATDLPNATGLLPRRVRSGTADMTQGPAMTREEAIRAVEVGIEVARDLVTAGNRGLLTGDMGIANTTASAALISVFTGADVAEVTGRGTGIDDATHERKIEVIKAALALHEPDPADPIGVLAAVGGLEHAAIAGYIIGAAALRVPVVLDGVIAGAAALVAQAIAPEAVAACVAGHRSAEPGHAAALAKLSLRPLVELELRLGEGTGAVLALPLVQSAVRVLHDVATFDSAGVSGKTD